MSESYEPSSNELTRAQEREDDDHGLSNALAWFQSIKEMVEALKSAEEAGEDTYVEQEQVAIQQSVLSCEVRSGWYSPAGGNADSAPAEFRILLTTGGPACQLVGELNEHGEPESARLETQDWGTPWKEVHATTLIGQPSPSAAAGTDEWLAAIDKAQAYLLTFASQFYFGEG